MFFDFIKFLFDFFCFLILEKYVRYIVHSSFKKEYLFLFLSIFLKNDIFYFFDNNFSRDMYKATKLKGNFVHLI